MTDKDQILIEDFFKQAAQQQIADNGFTERVMMNLPGRELRRVRMLSRLWSWFCIILAAGLFFAFGGTQVIRTAMGSLLQMGLNSLEVFLATAPTTEITVNPWMILLTLVLVVVYLPYQTYRRLSAAL